MASVFGADSGQPIVLKAGKAIVTVNGIPVIALNVTCQFGRVIQVVPALSKKRVVSIGEPQGTFSAETIIANGNDPSKAFKLTGDDCTGYEMTVKFDGKACDAGGKTVKCKNCFTQNVQITAQGGRGWIGSGFQVTFTALDM
jgi:hypothetical protein